MVATQTFLEFSSRNLGFHDPIWRAYFSNGLVQPPTRYSFNEHLAYTENNFIHTSSWKGRPENMKTTWNGRNWMYIFWCILGLKICWRYAVKGFKNLNFWRRLGWLDVNDCRQGWGCRYLKSEGQERLKEMIHPRSLTWPRPWKMVGKEDDPIPAFRLGSTVCNFFRGKLTVKLREGMKLMVYITCFLQCFTSDYRNITISTNEHHWCFFRGCILKTLCFLWSAEANQKKVPFKAT